MFFDFHKAFDTVPHRSLVDKLCQLGLNHQIVNWVHNYLVDRKQGVVVNGVSSLPMSVASGVPQGSILGPLLFLIYINDIVTVNIFDGSKIILYADDILLYRPISLPQDFGHLQNDVDKLQAYASANYMTFNASKCKFMLVSRKKQHTHPNPSISLNSSPLEFTPTFKYLGLPISSDLSWSSHIDNICSKAKHILGLLYRRFYRHSNEQALRQLYLSLVWPHLEYAAPVWSPHLNKYITMLERTQQFACKMCKIWDSSNNELLDRLHLPRLAQHRLYLSPCFMYRIIHGLMNFPTNIIVPSSMSSHYTRSYSLYQPFARTDSYLHSLPNTVSQWNILPEYVVDSPSLCSFKHNLSTFFLSS